MFMNPREGWLANSGDVEKNNRAVDFLRNILSESGELKKEKPTDGEGNLKITLKGSFEITLDVRAAQSGIFNDIKPHEYLNVIRVYHQNNNTIVEIICILDVIDLAWERNCQKVPYLSGWANLMFHAKEIEPLGRVEICQDIYPPSEKARKGKEIADLIREAEALKHGDRRKKGQAEKYKEWLMENPDTKRLQEMEKL
jgi:hypothetical protein